MQACAFHSPAFHPSPVYTNRAALCNFASIWAHFSIARDTRQQQTLFAQCSAIVHTPHSCSRLCARCCAANNAKHAFATPPRRLRIALCYNFSLFVIAFLLFHCLLPVIATDRTHRTPYTCAVLLLPARNPTNSFIRIRIANRRIPLSSFRALCTRHISTFAAKALARALLPPTLPPDTLFCLFRIPLFPQAVQGSAFLYVFVSCGTCVLSSAKTSMFIGVFARLCIFIHCVFA